MCGTHHYNYIQNLKKYYEILGSKFLEMVVAELSDLLVK